ncbi:Hsp20/alpha crystallin family protein [Nitrosococcus wardiae]|nr:Hsp20/alpha crystallin family protein [Nitrosococcus wardiae]
MQVLINSEDRAYPECIWQPPADIYRIEQGWLVKLDLAGVRSEDIHLSIQGQHLIIQGLRRDWIVEAGQQYYSMEIAYNRFKRVIEFPNHLEHARITTQYRDGMLLIWLKTAPQGGV